MPSYLVAIAWLYVTLLMSLAERSFVAGVATFVFYGLIPLAILLWLLDTPARRRRQAARNAASHSAPREGAAPGSGIDPDH